MLSKPIAVVPAIVALLAATNITAAQARDITISDGQTEGAQSLSGTGDTLFIASGGTLDSTSNVISITGLDTVTTNYGTIENRGTATYALETLAANTRVVNHGGIFSYEDCSYGVYATGDYFTLTNTGTIETKGSWAGTGIQVENSANNVLNVTLDNSGSIITHGTQSHGISLYGTSSRITNTGNIRTADHGSAGIYVYSPTTQSDIVITNSGTIHAKGGEYQTSSGGYVQSHGIQTNAANVHIINSGTVISEQFDAFAMGFANSKLTLLPGSVVSGGIRFSQAATGSLEIGNGLEGVIKITGELRDDQIETHGQAYTRAVTTEATEHRRNGDAATSTYTTFTVVSTASIEAANTATVQTASTVTSNIANHTGDRRQSLPSSTSALGYAPSPATPDFPDFAPSDDFGAWASAYGELTAPTSGKTGSKSLQGGALVGSDIKLSDESLAGLFVGLGRGHVETVSKSELDVTSLLGGGYASLAVGSVFIDINATLGVSANDSARRFVNNTVAAGYETAYANYVSMFASPSIKLGMDQYLGFARLTPSVTLTYAGIHQAGYSESGSSANVTMGSSFSQLLNARAELELGTIDLGEAGSGWSGSAKIGADGTLTYGGTTDAQVLGTTLSLAGNSTNAARGFIGANAQYQSGTYSFTAGTELGLNTQGMVSASLRGGVGMRF
ncbi:autotransporter outer membrane beta-barrel domain-containing protein [Devosia sp. WQ 349]|uniref:autotransporter outer membrane beta-barrel domain-containing protein n=1 Tax=Devosia sp. WQ 349K1 TaxID=2800329 RepID=UPI001907DD3C|nr:autotransporter outer membrane beta-barrel domain-containing protein [Devosia sp. WQ 349K1]MBK1793839.1 autotransporter outer membrane beta-barrel domain-containing protein [Devosia sp. WQ 349K1]